MPEPATGFTKSGVTPAELLESELYGVLSKASGEAVPLGEPVLFNKLRAAEDWLEQELQVFLGERRVVSNARARGLDPSTYDLDDPAYDWEPDGFAGERWGQLQLNYRPVVELTDFFISWPGGGFAPTPIPAGWLQVDYQFGQVEIVPMTSEAGLLIQLWQPVLYVLGAGRRIPKSIFVDYTAGISQQRLRREHANLLEAVRLRAALLSFGILANVRTGGLGSQSLSLDGLSRSESYNSGKWGPYSGYIEQAMAREQDILRAWKAAHRGVVMA